MSWEKRRGIEVDLEEGTLCGVCGEPINDGQLFILGQPLMHAACYVLRDRTTA